MSAVNPDPDDLIGIREALHEVELSAQRGPGIIRDAYQLWREADRVHEVARARAVLTARDELGEKSTVAERDAHVTLETIRERQGLDAADAVHRYAASRVRELENRRSSLQTRASLIRVQMALVGTGVTS